jgi:hypothetical protein
MGGLGSGWYPWMQSAEVGMLRLRNEARFARLTARLGMTNLKSVTRTNYGTLATSAWA